MTDRCRCVIVSGVVGAGKTTLARLLADELRWTYAEGESFHSELTAIARWIDDRSPATGTVVTCSALTRAHRDELALGRPWLRFCQLEAPLAVRARSQVATLEPLEFDEPGIVMNATEPPDRLVEDIVEMLDLNDDVDGAYLDSTR